MNDDRIKWLTDGSESLDREMLREYDQPEPEEAPDAFEMPHPRENRYYSLLHAWTHGRGERLVKRAYSAAAVLICIGICALLIATTADMPRFGDAAPLEDDDLSRFYVEEGYQHTGAANIVTGIILDFRGFDTLGESHVLFIAVCTVLMLLYLPKKNDPMSMREWLESEADDRRFEPHDDLILQQGAVLLVPLVLVFSIYILLNGHLSPGGGFSGGTVLGAGLILYLLAYDFQRTERFFNFRTYRRLTTAALLFYALSKGYIFFTGANGIPNGIGTGRFGAILSGGLLLPLNVAVGVVVACTMYVLYTLFRKGDL
ncbi:MAG: hypothetical protein J5998_10085 [Clostridia bacterium]|nr:hypothetical protein [Clostridia bacterium]